MKPLIILVLTLIALFVTGAAMPNLADKYAPFEIRWNECLICGRSQTVENRWRRAPVTKVEESDHSRWADTLSPGHKHHWATSSVESREEWFGSSEVGCGGIGGIGSFYYIHSHQGDDVAAPLVGKYLTLAKSGDLAAVEDFTRGELSKAVEVAVATRNNGQ